MFSFFPFIDNKMQAKCYNILSVFSFNIRRKKPFTDMEKTKRP